ncbi:hypothetical protein F5B20DRAFT_303653 [Whalleya microplaca]|nr:hypothetical protein F5B20DRAFT_303653 [Whalleya microplaca]
MVRSGSAGPRIMYALWLMPASSARTSTLNWLSSSRISSRRATSATHSQVLGWSRHGRTLVAAFRRIRIVSIEPCPAPRTPRPLAGWRAGRVRTGRI